MPSSDAEKIDERLYGSPLLTPTLQSLPADLLQRTSATLDGHEALVPDICPDVPPLYMRSSSVASSCNDDFPPVKSPLLMRARRVSLTPDSEFKRENHMPPHAEVTPGHEPLHPAYANGSVATPGPEEPVATPSPEEPVATPGPEEPVATPGPQEPAATPGPQEPAATPGPQEPAATADAEEAGAMPGAEEPAWLKERRLQRIRAERVDETLEQAKHLVQTGKHHYQASAPTELYSVPPASHFGFPVEMNTVFVSNLGSEVTADLLQRELEQIRHLPAILEVRLPSKRAFAYVDFDSPDKAATAVPLMDGRKINGKPIKAHLSQPQKPIYEPDVLFVPLIPENVTAERLQQAIEEAYHEHGMASGKRQHLEGETPAGKRAKTELQKVHEPVMEPGHEEASAHRKWEIAEIRIASSGGSRHAYVQFKHRGNVLDILNTQHALQKPLITLDDAALVFAASIPKKSKIDEQRKSREKWIEEMQEEKRKRRTLYLSNLPLEMKPDTLRKLCSKHGDVKAIAMPLDGKKSRGWALVEYADSLSSASAMSALQGHICGKRPLSVKQSDRVITRSKEEEEALRTEAEQAQIAALVSKEARAPKKSLNIKNKVLKKLVRESRLPRTEVVSGDARMGEPAEGEPEAGGHETIEEDDTMNVASTNDEFRRMLGL